MLSRHDELELMAIIEGELDDDRLAADPQARALVVAMRRDREVLRSEPEPQMPHDLADRIERALTRPMLIAAWGEDDPAADPSLPLARDRAVPAMRPGEFRRRHHWPARRLRIIRSAMAASIGLLLMGGLWAGINTALNIRGDHNRTIAQHEADRPDERVVQIGPESAPPAAGSTIHHHAPQPVLETHLAQRAPAPATPADAPQTTDDPIAVEFALVIQTDDRSVVEASIKELLAARGDSVALVLHMSRDEAMRILEERMASHSPHRAPVRTSPAGPPRPLAGSQHLAASFGQQLDYASRGATHTMTIRLSQLPALLEDIERAAIGKGAKRSALQPLPDIFAAERRRAADERLWITGRSIVREAIEKLEEVGGDPLIHLPVVIE